MPNTLIGARADDLLDQIVHSYVEVGQFSSLIAKGSRERRFLFIQNDGNEDVYMMFGRPAAIHQGICLFKAASAMFSACNSSLCCQDLYGITRASQSVRILISEGY